MAGITKNKGGHNSKVHEFWIGHKIWNEIFQSYWIFCSNIKKNWRTYQHFMAIILRYVFDKLSIPVSVPFSISKSWGEGRVPTEHCPPPFRRSWRSYNKAIQSFKHRYSTRGHWMQKSVRQIINLGCFGLSGLLQRKENPNCHKNATFEVSFFMFSWSKKH